MWAKVGGTLIVDRDHSFGAPITAILLPGLAYRLKSEGSRVLNYIGPAYHWAFSLYSEGKTAVLIEGDLTIDGADRVCIPFYAKFDKVEGGLRRDFSVDGLRCRNARMAHVLSPIDGAPINLYGACGMLFAGGFDHLHLRNVSVDNVTRAARAGTPFYQGSVGIGVVAKLNSTCSARHVTIEEFAVSHVDSEDPPGSEHRVDMDGVLVFQSEEKDGSRPLIQSGIVREAAGRAVKIFAPGGGGVTRKIQIFRSVPSTIYGAVEIDHQHGDGVVADIDITYSGRAHLSPTTVIGMGSNSARRPGFPFAAGAIADIRIRDYTNAPKAFIASLYYSVADPSPRSFTLTNISDEGTARNLLLTGALGTYGSVRVTLDRINVDLKASLLMSDDPTQLLAITARNSVFSRGRAVIVKTRHDGAPAFADRDIFINADASVTGLKEPVKR